MLKSIARAFDPTADAITLLKEDHRKVEGLFAQFESAEDKRSKGTIARQICTELDLHARIEEAVFYPTAKREAEQAEDQINEGMVEHEGIKRLVGEIQGMSPGDELFDAKVSVLMEYVKHHVKEEENEMFPKIRESDLDLMALREQLEAAKERMAKMPKTTKSSRGRPAKTAARERAGRKSASKRRPVRRAAKRRSTQSRGKGRKRG
jgi:hemerythrin superfamily protein